MIKTIVKSVLVFALVCIVGFFVMVGVLGATFAGTCIASSEAHLPQATIDYLNSRNVKELAQQNMAAYQAAAEKDNLPWQAIAALHYREGSMNPGQSVLNGQPITGVAYENIDGQTIQPTLLLDAINAGEVFKRLAKGVYGVTIPKDISELTVEQWAEVFVSYNRGYLYQEASISPADSPYSMNGLDGQHMNMRWPSADKHASGTDGNKAGALAVMIYLGDSNAASAACADGAGDVVLPVKTDHPEITDIFGAPRDGERKHMGIDIVGGSVIQAIMPGKVTVAQNDFYGYGTAVEIDHGNGIRTRYGHMVEGSLLVHVGDTVTAGQPLGTMGDTGHSFGVHLHFEVMLQSGNDWNWTDPEKWLAEHGITIPRQ